MAHLGRHHLQHHRTGRPSEKMSSPVARMMGQASSSHCAHIPIVFSPELRPYFIGQLAIDVARLYNPRSKIVVIANNVSGGISGAVLAALHARRVTLMTTGEIEVHFREHDRRGLSHLEQKLQVLRMNASRRLGRDRVRKASRSAWAVFARYAYLWGAWVALGLQDAFHIELDVLLTAPLGVLCHATGWSTARFSRVAATASFELGPRCEIPGNGSIHAAFVTASYVREYWVEASRWRDIIGLGVDMRLTNALLRRGFLTANTYVPLHPRLAPSFEAACVRRLHAHNISFAGGGATQPDAARGGMLRSWSLTQASVSALLRQPSPMRRDAPSLVVMPHMSTGVVRDGLANVTLASDVSGSSPPRVFVFGLRAGTLHFQGRAKRRLGTMARMLLRRPRSLGVPQNRIH